MLAQAAMCLLSLLYATIQQSLLYAFSTFYMPQYSRAYCVPAQPSICHNTAEPTVCLLSLLYATIQPSLLYACSAFYMPQYSQAYCVPAQPSICHNTAEPTVCMLNFLYATIQPSLLYACSAFYMPQYSRAYCMPAQLSICHNTAEPTVCLLSLLYATIQPSLLYAYSAFYMPQYSRAYCMPAQPSICHNTAEPCNTLSAYPLSSCSLMIHSVYCYIILANFHSYAAIQIFFFLFQYTFSLLQYTSWSQYSECIAIQSCSPALFKSQYTSNLAIQFPCSQAPILQNSFLQQPSCSCHNTMVYCNTKFPAQPSLACNTIIVLQYNFQA